VYEGKPYKQYKLEVYGYVGASKDELIILSE
jgi:hypothetical protein